jgi:SAM-dependent methyltransferase
VSFEVPADAYDRFMGVHSRQLAPQLADLAELAPDGRALDVGCGPGSLTTELVARLGEGSVAAVDPSETFVVAARERHPGVDVQRASAEALPYPDSDFDAALAQLVVHFMTDPVAGIREMARVTLPDGVVAACVWDHAGERSPLAPFWQAAHELEIGVVDESGLPGARKGHLVELFEAAGLREIEESELVARVEYASVDDWLEPFSFGVGPAGAAYAGLDPQQRAELDQRCRDLLGPPPFVLESVAWAARGVV